MEEATTLSSAAPATNYGSSPEPPDVVRARRILSGDVHPDDYLPVPDAVRSRIDRLLAEARARLNGADPSPEFIRWHLVQEVLSFHHGGERILYLERDDGIVVLASGLERCAAVIRIVTPTDPVLSTCAPDPW